MNFQDVIYQIRCAYENADARNIFEHVVIQFQITGEISGVFYLEVAERQISVEPYPYEGADAYVTISTDVMFSLIRDQVSTMDAIAKGMVDIKGNMDKVYLLQKMTRKK